MRVEISQLKGSMTEIIQISMLTILLSIGLIATVDLIKCRLLIDLLAMGIIFILLFVSLWKTFKGIKIGLN